MVPPDHRGPSIFSGSGPGCSTIRQTSSYSARVICFEDWYPNRCCNQTAISALVRPTREAIFVSRCRCSCVIGSCADVFVPALQLNDKVDVKNSAARPANRASSVSKGYDFLNQKLLDERLAVRY